MSKLAKRQKASNEMVDRDKMYGLTEAVETLMGCPAAKFDESVDVALDLNIDPRHADQMVRGSINLPNGTGKTARVIVFAKGDAAEAAEKSGADIVGTDDLADKIKGGFLDFDRVVAAPDCMAIVGQLGKVLGPKGLMPNPKLGTVTPNVAKAVEDIKSGMFEYRSDKHGIVHAMVGKRSFGASKVEENIAFFMSTIKAVKPSGVKGIYMNSLSISATMGPGIKIDLGSLN